MFYVDAIDTDENFVDKDLANAFDCRRPNEREPVATQKSAGDNDLQMVAVTQLHRDIYGIRQHGDSFMKTNAACDLRRRGSRADREDVSVADQFRGDETYATFFCAALPLLLVVVRDVTKRFVKQRLHRHSAAVAATQQSALFQLAEVAADRRGRHLQSFSEWKDSDLTGAQQFLQNQLSASLIRSGFVRHLRNLWMNKPQFSNYGWGGSTNLRITRSWSRWRLRSSSARSNM